MEDTMSSERHRKDIAVIGMSCRLPGANSVSEFWEILKNGEDQVRLTPRNRFDLIPGLTEIQGGFLRDPLDEFDAPFFNVSAKEAPFIDPQQRLFLEVAIEGLESARIPASSLRKTKTGIFCGVAFSQYRNFVEPVVNVDNSALYYEVMGCGWSAIPGRLAHYLDVNGPNIVAEAGCASSAVSLNQAIQSLRLGESSLAIVGGVNLMLDKSIRIPPVIITDRCRTFDASAKGFAPAEGIAVVILKVLEDAVRDADYILGIIRGTATNHNGTTRSLGTPSAKAQTELIHTALAEAQVTANEITYFEAHGTGTKAGDPTEAEAICRVFESNNRPSSHPLFISSTKTYLGHTLSASCLAGLIRILLSMRHGQIPKHLHLANLHPKIDFQHIPGRIPLESCSWKPRDGSGVLVAGLNSFGLAGTNVHFVVQSGYSPGVPAAQSTSATRGSHLFPISAKDPSALTDLVQLYLKKMKEEEGKVDLAELAYSLSTTRTHYSHRFGIVARNEAELLAELEKGVSREKVIMSETPEPLVFLFTGFGAGTLENCRELYDTSPVFRATFNEASDTLQSILGKSLAEVVWDPKFSQSKDPIYAQPALFCIQYCFWKLWLSFLGEKVWDHPLVVLGHSFGEYAASVAAGYLTFNDGLKLVCCRAKLVSEIPEEFNERSGMLAIRGNSAQLSSHIEEFLKTTNVQNAWIDIATVNSPKQTVVSAALNVLEEFETYIKTEVKVPVKRLQTSHGFHSRAMDPILEKYRETLDSVVFKPKEPNITYISALLGQEANAEDVANTSYWVRHLREPVQFSRALGSIFEGFPESRIFIEIGSSSVLLKLVKENGEEDTVRCPSMDSSELSTWHTLNTSLKGLYENWNGEICWESIYENYTCTKIDLPHYPFQHKKYWIGKGSSRDPTEALPIATIGGSSHPFLGMKLDLATPSQITYSSHISAGSETFWKDSKVAGSHMLPMASCIEAILNLHQSQTVRLTNIRMTQTIKLDSSPVRIQTTVSELKGPNQHVAMFSKRKDEHKWMEMFQASISSEDVCSQGKLKLDAFLSRNSGTPATAIYEQLGALGLVYNPGCPLIETVRVSENFSTGAIFQTVPLRITSPRHVCNPLLFDAMLQAYLLFTTKKSTSKMLRQPGCIEQFSWCGADGRANDDSTSYFIYISELDEVITLADAQGHVLATMRGVVLMQTTIEEFGDSIGRSLTNNVTEGQWRESPELIVEKFHDMRDWEDLGPNLNVVNDPNQIPQRRLRYDSLCYKYILRLLLVDGGWNPKVGALITPSDLESLFSSYKHGVNVNCFRRFVQVLTEENFLIYSPSGKDWKVVKELNQKEMIELENCEFYKEVLHPSDYAELEAQLTRHFGEGLPRVFKNEITPLQHMFNSHPNLHMGMFYGDIPEAARINQKLADTLEQEVFSCCPQDMTLQILEIGAGTGSTTAQILRRLDTVGVRYKYTFTDIGPSFLAAAKTKFSGNADRMCFELLNIEKDPRTQGIAPGSFHVIIGANVIHATKNLSVVLQNARSLLAPSGFFGLIEVFRTERFTDLTAAMLDGWWLFEDERVGNLGPLIPSKTWTKILAENGFRNPVTIGPDSWSYGSIVCRADPSYRLPFHKTQRNWILCSSEGNVELVKTLAHQLTARDPASNLILGLKQDVYSKEKMENGQIVIDFGTPIDFSRVRSWIENNNCELEGFFYVGRKETDENEFADALRMLGELDSRKVPKRVVLIAESNMQRQKSFEVSRLQTKLNAFAAEYDQIRTLGIDLDLTVPIEDAATQIYHLLYEDSQVPNRQVIFRSGKVFVPCQDELNKRELEPLEKVKRGEPMSRIKRMESLAQQVLDNGLNGTQKTAVLEQILELCLRIHAALPDSEGALNPNMSLGVYGMDSLMAMEIQQTVSKLLGIKMSPDLFLQQNTIRGLATALSPLLTTKV